MIDTKLYRLTKKQYIRVFIKTLRRNALKLIPFILLWGLLLGWYIGYFLVLYTIFALVVLSFIVLWWFSAKNLTPFYAETHLRFDDEFLYISKNNTTSQWKFTQIIKMVSENDYWLLYLTKTEYLYVSKDIFLTEKDKTTFKLYIND